MRSGEVARISMSTSFRVWACLALLAGAPAIGIAQTFFAGTVVDGGNQPIAGASVDAGHMTFPIFGQFISDGQAVTDALGHFAITTLAAGDGSGSYLLVARAPGRITIIYPDVPNYGSSISPPPNISTPVAAPNLAANFTLQHPASIAGHVTRTDTNAPVAGATVNLSGWATYL